MKKILSLSTVVLLLFAILVTPVLAHKDNASYGDVPKSADAITIDGSKDAVYDKGLVLTVDLDKLYGDDGCPAHGTAWLLWQDGFIYIYAEVNDPYIMPVADYADESGQPWMTDSLEAFLDPDNNLDGDEFDQFRIDAYGWRSFELRATGDRANSYGADENEADGIFEGKAKIAGGVYSVEFKIPTTKSAGANIGLLLQINDMNADGERTLAFTRASKAEENQMSWVPANADYIVLSATEVTAVEATPEPEAPAAGGGDVADVEIAPVIAAATTAPAVKTGDAGMIFAVIALLASGASVFVLKTKKDRA